jgi:diguanylate cyclase (GGDEF)-like protein
MHRPEKRDLEEFAPSRSSVGRTAGVLFAICGALSLVGIFTPLGRGGDLTIMLVLASACIAAGCLCWLLPWNAWPRWVMHSIVLVAFTLIALGIMYSGEFFLSYGVFFCVAFTMIGIAHPPWTGLETLPLYAVACILPVYGRTGDLALAVSYAAMVGLVSIVIAEIMSWKGERLKRSQFALWRAHAAVNEISVDLASLDPRGTAWNAASRLSLRFEVPDVDIYRLAESGALTRLAAVVDYEPDHDARRVQREDIDAWPAGSRAVGTKEPVRESMTLTVPLIARDRVVGLVEMRDTREGRGFSAEKMAAVGPACQLIALSIQDAEALSAEQAIGDRLASLLDVSRTVASADTLEEALAKVTRCGADILGVSECLAYEYLEEIDAIIPRALWEATASGWDRLGDVMPLSDYHPEADVLASGEPLLENISDPLLDPASRARMSQWNEKSCLTIPMPSADGPMGLLTFWDMERERSYPEGEMAVATGLAEMAGEVVRSTKLLRRLERLSGTDSVTGLANHRQIHEILAKEQARTARSGSSFCVVMLDIDGFKLLNDTHGHPCGDEALRHVAATLQRNVRETDEVGRYGGDEFVIILPGTGPEEAGVVVENLRAAVSEKPFLTPAGDHIPIQISFGIAGYPDDAHSVNELVVAADANLYVSKRRGGNAVTGAGYGDHVGDDGGERFGFLESMVAAVDNKDAYTRRHSDEVTEYAVMIATALDLSESTMGVVRAAGLLHDVGKIGIPDRILRKPGRLTDAEYAIVKGHPSIGETLIHAMPGLSDIRAAVVSHHERFDGGGYPHGLTGGEIPLLGRILAVADSFSAMTTDRPYHKALTRDEACAELKAGEGSQFDPGIVETFIQCLQSSGNEPKRMLVRPFSR